MAVLVTTNDGITHEYAKATKYSWEKGTSERGVLSVETNDETLATFCDGFRDAQLIDPTTNRPFNYASL